MSWIGGVCDDVGVGVGGYVNVGLPRLSATVSAMTLEIVVDGIVVVDGGR